MEIDEIVEWLHEWDALLKMNAKSQCLINDWINDIDNDEHELIGQFCDWS